LPYAQFYKGGPVNAFFILPQFLAAREAAELAQRMDLEMFGTTTLDSHSLALESEKDPYTAAVEGASLMEREADMLMKLRRDPQVTIIGNFDWTGLPDSVQQEILRRVRAGMGLVIVYNRGLPEEIKKALASGHDAEEQKKIIAGWPRLDIPHLRFAWPPTAEQVGVCRLGEGRIVFIDWYYGGGDPPPTRHGGPGLTPQLPYDFHSVCHYQYYLALVARALLWAADRSPQYLLTTERVIVPELQPDEEGIIPWDEPVIVKLTLQAEQAANGQLVYQLRDDYGRLEAQGEQPVSLQKGDNEISLELPRRKHGKHWLDPWLKQDRQTLTWGTVGVHFDSPRLAEVRFDTDTLKPGWPYQGTVRLTKPLATGEKLFFVLRDGYDRILQERELPARYPQAVSVHVIIRRTSTLALRPQVVVRRGDEVVCEWETVAYGPLKPRNRFHFIAWGQNDYGILAHYAYEQMKEYGCDTILRWPQWQHNRLLACTDLYDQPFVYRTVLRGSAEAPYSEKPQGFHLEWWHHPPSHVLYLEDWGKTAESIAKYGILAYSLGDEIMTGGRDVGYSDFWMPAFHQYLKCEYLTLARLNGEWGTDFRTWAEVRPQKSAEATTAAQVAEKAAVSDRSWGEPGRQEPGVGYAAYIDHRLFVEKEFAGMFPVLRETLRRYDPQAGIGFEGAGSFEAYYMVNYPELAARMDMWAPYYSLSSDTMLDAFANNDLIWGNWWGGYVGQRRNDVRVLNFMLWDIFQSGANSIWWYSVGPVGDGALSTDLSPTPYFPSEDLGLVRDGLGEWLARADVEYDQVAIHYSQSSLLVSAFEYPWAWLMRQHHNWLCLLFDLGLQPRYVSSAQIEQGALINEGYRVLILPSSLALSGREAREIERFVRQGGLLLADMRPGVTDEHGKYLEQGQLDVLFGIQRTTTLRRTEAEDITAPGTLAGVEYDLQVYHTEVDTTVWAEQAGATLPGGTPVLITRKVGKGMVVLLNFLVESYLVEGSGAYRTDYYLQRDVANARGLRELVYGLLTQAGVHPRAVVRDTEGLPLSTCRAGYRKLGQARLLILQKACQQNDQRYRGPIYFNQPYHVYDVRKGRKLGHGKSIATALVPARASLLALLPYEPTELRVSLQDRPQSGSAVPVRVELRARGGTPDGHLVRIEVRGPDGELCPWFRQFISVEQGQGRGELFIACDEPAGTYQIEATDVLTGTRGQATFNLP